MNGPQKVREAKRAKLEIRLLLRFAAKLEAKERALPEQGDREYRQLQWDRSWTPEKYGGTK